MRKLAIALTLLVGPGLAAPLQAAVVPFTGTLEIKASVGSTPASFQLLSVPVSGTATVSGTVVKIPAGEISVAVPSLSGFGGTLVNGAATFSAGGAGAPPTTCPLLTGIQEVCIDGGGFGGAMALSGVTQMGQPLVVWGLAGSNTGMTVSGLSRVEAAQLWTDGRGTAWYFILETDPTPFALSSTGTFRGLPASAMADAGFSLVTPLVVTAAGVSSADNARAVAKLRIDFTPRPVPLGGMTLLGAALGLLGALRLRRSLASRRSLT